MKVTASLYPFKFIAVKVKAKKDGGGGFRKRLRAYELHNSINLSDVPFGIIHAAPNMLQKTDALDVAKAIKAWGGAWCMVQIVAVFLWCIFLGKGFLIFKHPG